MEENPNPWTSFHNSSKKLNVPDLGQQNINTMALPAYTNHRGETLPPHGLVASKFLQNSALNLHLNSMNLLPSGASGQKSFLIFDQSGDHTSLIFSSVGSPFWNSSNTIDPKTKASNPHGLGVNLPVYNDPTDQSNETNVSNGHGGDETHHEDTEEIDALLYSDSEDGCDEDEEASTGRYSPPVALTGSGEGVASSGKPRKRRRVLDEEGMDESLMDTASSARAHPGPQGMDHKVVEEDENCESSCVKKGGAEEEVREEGCSLNYNSCKRLKREKIQEILGVLRSFIPGGKGKDAAGMLDEAIQYLRSLKTEAQALGGATL